MSDRRRRDYRSRSRSYDRFRRSHSRDREDRRDRDYDRRYRRSPPRDRERYRRRNSPPHSPRNKDSGGLSNPPPEHPDANPGNNLYVSQISPDTREQDLKDHFSKFGELQDVRIVNDPHTRESRGFGFVTFEDPQAAEEAVKAMDGELILGKNIRVEKARRCKPHEPTPGSYCGPAGASSKNRFSRRRRSPSPLYNNRRRSYSR